MLTPCSVQKSILSSIEDPSLFHWNETKNASISNNETKSPPTMMPTEEDYFSTVEWLQVLLFFSSSHFNLRWNFGIQIPNVDKLATWRMQIKKQVIGRTALVWRKRSQHINLICNKLMHASNQFYDPVAQSMLDCSSPNFFWLNYLTRAFS